MGPSKIVMYHGGGCADGFGAAWCASLALGRGEDVRYAPMQYGDPLPPEIDLNGPARTVYMVDFSLKRQAMQFVAALSESTICLDHHKSAAQELAGLEDSTAGIDVIFDMGKSGAMLAWEYFHEGEPAPDLIRYVQDRDLWTWALPDSKAINAAIASYPRTFETWDWLREQLDNPIGAAELVVQGEAIARHVNSCVAGLVEKARLVDVGGHVVLAVNTPLYQSEVGEALCLKYPDRPFAATYFVRTDSASQIEDSVWSLRSRGGFDVSEVARSKGGGGHAAAAGFTAKPTPTPSSR